MYAPNNTLKIHEAKLVELEGEAHNSGERWRLPLPVIGRTGRRKIREDILG